MTKKTMYDPNVSLWIDQGWPGNVCTYNFPGVLQITATPLIDWICFLLISSKLNVRQINYVGQRYIHLTFFPSFITADSHVLASNPSKLWLLFFLLQDEAAYRRFQGKKSPKNICSSLGGVRWSCNGVVHTSLAIAAVPQWQDRAIAS